MKKCRFTEQQIAYALRQAESGVSIQEITRKMAVTEATFYRWKKKFAGMGVAELRRLKQLEEENKRLNDLVAYLNRIIGSLLSIQYYNQRYIDLLIKKPVRP